MNNYILRKSRLLSILLFVATILLIAFSTASCVSVKRYKALKADYQRAAEGDRAYEQIKANLYADSVNRVIIQERGKGGDQ